MYIYYMQKLCAIWYKGFEHVQGLASDRGPGTNPSSCNECWYEWAWQICENIFIEIIKQPYKSKQIASVGLVENANDCIW